MATSDPITSPLSDEQRERAAANKAKALAKRASAGKAAPAPRSSPARASKTKTATETTSTEGGKTKSKALANFFAPKAKRPKTAVDAAPKAPPPTPTEFLASVGDSEWRAALSGETKKPYLKSLAAFVAGERRSKTVFPPAAATFAALDACPLSAVKVVIVGQDPYHGPGQAHGLCFSIAAGSTGKYPPSLRNLLKECAADVKASMPAPGRGDLAPWAKRGVLLLNACLSVRKGEANSHAKRGWEQLTDAIVAAVNDRPGRGCVFLLWGKPAANKCGAIDGAKHRILSSSHPSPLSNTKTATPFTGSRCFSRANALLVDDLGYDAGIDWDLA